VITDLDRQLAAVKRQWSEAAGDAAKQAAARAEADRLRASGASESVANWLTTGNTAGAGEQYSQQYMGSDYSAQADWDQRQAAASAPTGGTASALTAALPTLTGPTTYKMPSFTETPGTKTDLTPLYNAVEEYKNQPINMPTATTPQTVTADQLAQAIAAQNQGVAPEAMQAQFASPEQWQGYIEAARNVLQPYAEQQKAAATSAYNQAMQNLRNRAAATGMQRSGGYVANAMGAANQLASTVANVDAATLQQALSSALQMGQMTTQEAQAIWNQKMSGAQFAQDQATTQAQLLGNALANQEQQRLNEVGQGLQLEGMRQDQQQNALGNLINVGQTDSAQNQWAQELGLERKKLDTSNWLNTQQLNQNAQNAYNANVIDVAQLGENQRQFDKGYDLEVGQLELATRKQAATEAMDALQAQLNMDKEAFDQWLDGQKLELSKLDSASERSYKSYLKSKGLTTDQGDAATNGYLTQLLALDGPEAAFQYIVTNAKAISDDGADVSKIMSTLRNRWPQWYTSNGGTADLATMLDWLSSEKPEE